ncbi:MAG: hypothetical protein ACUVRK_00935 [Spirochaetota bacterium]
MKSKFTIIVLIVIAIVTLKPWHAKCLSHALYKSYISLYRIADDSVPKEDQPSKKSNNEQPQDDNTNEDTMDHHDSESDEDLEEIPDDFYDYQEENF